MYGSFAKGYHKIMAENDYERFADYYEKIFEKLGVNPSLVLDLGCGSGSLTSIMADRGYDMIGIDISPEMLNIAKNENQRDNILYLCQDMRSFELYGTVDAIYSSLDCVNYLTSPKDILKMLKLLKNYLNPGGIMIFDMNTEYYFENILDGKTHIFENEDVYLVWQSDYSKKKRICSFYLDMFYREGEVYERFCEEQRERAYSVEEIRAVTEEAGHKLIKVYDAFSFRKPRENSERIFFIIKN